MARRTTHFTLSHLSATQACDSPGGALLLKDGAFSSPLAAPQPTTAELLAAGRCSDRSGSSASYLANFQLPGELNFKNIALVGLVVLSSWLWVVSCTASLPLARCQRIINLHLEQKC